jgi:general secretion pathway protein D
VDAYAPANLLFITERASQVNRLVEIVKKIDVAGFEEKWEIIQLKHQSADTLAQKITDMLSDEVAAVSTGQRAAPLPRSRTTGRPTERVRGTTRRGPSIVGAVQTPLRIIPDEWSNSLIVVGVESMRLKVRQIVEQLDVESPFEGGNVHVYIVKNADCTEVATALESLMTTGRARSRTGASGTRQPQQPGQPGAPGAVQAFAKEVSIAAYEPINALLITAGPQDWLVLENVLEQIDVPESQVYVEVVIMQVTIKDDVTVGVELAAIDEDDFAAISTFGDLANFVTQGPLGFTGGLVGVVDGTMDVRDPLSGQMVSVPKVPVLITAIQTATDLDVLSAPALLTTDNKQSKIHVGKNIPIVSGSARPLNQPSVGQLSTVYNQVTRQDIGVTLPVTPQVSRAGDYVKMEIIVEVSDTIESEVGIDPNTTGPTLRKTDIEDTVIIQDGYMGIVGGLMSQGENRTRSQVPLLGDIPLLGWLFRKSGRIAEKSNLVVIITPHIVDSGEKLDELTARYREEYDLQRLEMRQDMRYWRKVFKRVDTSKPIRSMERTTSRVSEEHADRVLGRNSDR